MAVEKTINIKIKDNAKAAVGKINSAFKSARTAAKRVGDATKAIGKQAKLARGGVRLLSKGFKAMGRVAKAAVAATGIGALFVIIQSVVSENQKVMDTFNLIGKIAGKVVGDLIGGITKLVTSPKDFSKNIQDFVLKRFEQLKEALGILGGAFIKLFKGDFKGALADAKGGFVEMFDVITGEDGGLETIKEYAVETYNVAKAAVEGENALVLLRAQSDKIKESLEGQMEAERALRDDSTQSIATRLEANERLKKQAEEFISTRKALAAEELKAAQAKLAIDKDNIEAQAAVIEAEKQMQTVIKEGNALRKDNQIQENALKAEAVAILQSEQEAINEANKIAQDGEINRMMNIRQRLQAQRDALDEQYDADAAALQSQIDSLEAGTSAHQEAVNQKKLLDANYENAKADSEQAITQNARAEQEARLNMASATLGSLSSLMDAFQFEDEKKQKKLFRVQKALNLSQAAMNTYNGVTSALADTKGLTGFERWGNAIAVGVAGAANIAKIATTKFGGTAGNPEATQPRPQSLSTPSQGVFNSQDGINQILSSGQNSPIRAYVVSSEVTTQQELDRKRTNKASF